MKLHFRLPTCLESKLQFAISISWSPASKRNRQRLTN